MEPAIPPAAAKSADVESSLDDRGPGRDGPLLNDRSGSGSRIRRTSSAVLSESSSGVSRGAAGSAA